MTRQSEIRWTTTVLVAAAIMLACTDPTASGSIDDISSFEQTLVPWHAVAIDTGITSGAHATWSIVPSRDESSDGEWSAKLTADNLTDAVKVWLERRYVLAPSASGAYDVTIAFDFGTSDAGNINLWRLVAGAFPAAPRSADALSPAFREETGGGVGGEVRWIRKAYTMRVVSDRANVHVVVGVWGTFETTRTYYIDNVRVVITPALTASTAMPSRAPGARP